MVKEKPIPGGKKSRKEPAKSAQLAFTPVKIEISDPVSLILLLWSKEVPVLVQVLSPLTHYAQTSEDCATHLIKNNILPILLSLLTHENECCKRYAYRMMSHLVFNENCKQIMIDQQETTFKAFLDTLLNSTDIILQEYSSKILSVLCQDHVLCASLANATPIETYLKCLSSTDPDVQKNVLEIMISVSRDPSVKPSEEFTFLPIIQLIFSDYPAIQIAAIEVIFRLTERRKDIRLKELFKNSGGVNKIMMLLERFDWKNLHNKLLLIISNLAESQEELEILSANDIKLLMSYALKATDVNDIQQAWNAILALSNIRSSRKVLVELHILEKIVTMLKAENESLASCACIGLINFMLDSENLAEISKLNPIPAILFLMKNGNEMKTKENALVALREALKNCPDVESFILENNKYEIITSFLKLPLEEVSVALLKAAIECLIILSQAETFRSVLDPSIMTEVVHIFKETREDSLRIAALGLLNQLLCDEIFSSNLADEFIDVIWKTIVKHHQSLPTAAAAAQFIETSVKNNDVIANAFIKTGALHWMFSFKDVKNVPVWQSAINALFSKHLSAKFAYKGRLEFTDIIKNQFYVRKIGVSKQKQLEEKFPVYEDILNTSGDLSLPPIYLINLITIPKVEEIIKRKSSAQSRKSNAARSSKFSTGKEIKNTSEIEINESGDSIKFDYRSEDFFLMKYIQQVKKLIKEAQIQTKNEAIKKDDIKDYALTDTETEALIELVAKYVCNQLSGPDRGMPCTNHYLGLHIEQLKNELSSNLIPIGLLRAGLVVERAILFKVIADQVGLPCALVRGSCGQAWVEVCLPAVSPSPPFYPTTFLKSTHIVDLLHAGNLLQLGSFAANKYSTCPSLCAYDNLIN